LVVGSDGTGTVSIWLIDLSGATPNRALVTDSAVVAKPWGLAADEETQTLYWNNGTMLWKAAYTSSGPITPILVGTITLAGAGISITSLAYDTVENKLYGYRSVTAPGFYDIDVNTAVATLAVATPASTDFGGFDYDPVGDVFYGLNDSTGLAGRGLYRITKPLATATYTRVVAYPGTETDIDGLAIGPNAYWVNDVGTQPIFVTDLAGASLPNVTNPLGAGGIFSGGAYAPGMLIVPPGVDLALSKSAPANCSVSVGETLTYTIIVRNVGSTDATNATVVDTLPPDTTFVSSNPPGVPVGNQLTVNLGGVTGLGGEVVMTVDVIPNVSGVITNSATVAADQPEDNMANNSGSAGTLVPPAPPTVAEASGVISTVASSPTSLIPELGGRFTDFQRPYRSPNGQRWAMVTDSDFATTVDGMVITGNGTTISVAVQEGATLTPEGDIVGIIDSVTDINDAGQYVYSTNTSATVADEVVVKWNGASYVTVAREDGPVPGIPGATYGTTSSSVSIASDGLVSFLTTLLGVPTASDTATLTDDGATLVDQEGTTIPTGQNGGSAFTWKSFDAGSVSGGFSSNADGTQFATGGAINDPDLNFDRVIVITGAVTVQENVIISGSGFVQGTDISTPFNFLSMESDGSWYAYGDNNDDIDWAARNGAIVGVTDQPIHTGATELWDDAGFAQTFFLATGNNNGDYVVGGTTNSGNTLSDAVLTLNGQQVLIRENAPIDLDNNGLFDDGTYLSVFRDDQAFMTDTELWIVVRMRNEAQALCGTGTNDIGQALIRIPLPPTGCPGAGCDDGGVDADFDDDCIVSLSDLSILLGNFGGSGSVGDTNGDAVVDLADLANLLARFGNDCTTP
jgi:uncharacterized repeat protein (TIGR01451 family)